MLEGPGHHSCAAREHALAATVKGALTAIVFFVRHQAAKRAEAVKEDQEEDQEAA